jgi:hypothetical protein
MNGMHEKKLRKEKAKRFTQDGLPRDAKEWTVQDWSDLFHAMESVIRKVGKRHEADRRAGTQAGSVASKAAEAVGEA